MAGMVIPSFGELASSLTVQAIRWRPLEAALAAIGSQAEPVLDCVQDEQDSGREKPIDIENFLANVIPSILNLPREFDMFCPIYGYASLGI
jgi:hypothetical protein